VGKNNGYLYSNTYNGTYIVIHSVQLKKVESKNYKTKR